MRKSVSSGGIAELAIPLFRQTAKKTG